MKKLTLSRGEVSYHSRGLDTIDERESALQEDCIAAVKACVQGIDSKSEAEKIAKMILAASAAVHSDLERILRTHGKEEVQ